ncbi:disease resistance protein RGA2-like [Impatiens glandulifera]|uniref:disease resistance protein RGA2-like n=1 Tax=Impatiens glandulifera TaxID=253017 RepID=UPI001FB09646|nr:disease resistance protein RGA2-like [Impatiens glandulifera]
MPRGMGQLKHLKTLSLFVISNKERYCQLDELKDLDIGGSLKIKNLGSVTDASKERKVSMAKMMSINELELEWRTNYEDDDYESTRIRDEKIGEALEVSTARLKKLKMSGYKGVNLPKWAGKSCPSLTRLELKGLVNVNIIAISSDDNEMIVLYPLLEELVVVGMKKLRELVSPSCTGAFPNLTKLAIWYCPKLGALPPHLKSLKDVTVIGECSNELLYSIWNLNGTLTHLNLNELNNDVEHIFTVNNNRIEVVLFPLLEELKIGGMKNLRELVCPTISSAGAFPNLSRLRIFKCPKLGALPPHLKSLKDVYIHGECSDELLYSISNLSALTLLTLIELGERSVLFGGVRSTFQSLQSLSIERCPKLRRLFDEGMIMQETFMNRGTRGLISSLTELITNTKICCCQNKDFMNSLTELISNTKIGDCQNKDFMNSLTGLDIRNCPELMISLEEFRNFNINNSLRRLYIRRCPKLVFSEEADDFMALLRSLRNRLDPENFDVDIKLEVIT